MKQVLFLIAAALLVFSAKAQFNPPTVKIAGQLWMKENLDVSTYRNGDSISEVKDPEMWQKLTTGAWCYYDNDPATGKLYGKLYNWYAVKDPRGLAPAGWYVPGKDDWIETSK